MKHIIYPATILAAGLAVSQIVFFFVIFHSNLILHEKMTLLEQAGYLVVPNANVMAELTRIPPAFNGALFFTFTTGAGLCLVAMALAWIYKRLFTYNILFAFFLLAGWLICIAAVNLDGFSLVATAPFLFIPPVVFALSVMWMPVKTSLQNRLIPAVQIVVVILVALAWLPKTDAGVFIDIRDNILLTNPVGKAINDFYYKYTLYPAKILKTPRQKLMAPACTGGITDTDLRRRIENILVAHDYLPVVKDKSVNTDTNCDLVVRYENEKIYFFKAGKTILTTSPASFFSFPGKTLADFSSKTDNQAYFRTITFYSLFSALPLSLFILAHGFFYAFLFMISSISTRHIVASLICLLAGITAAIPLYLSFDSPVSRQSEIQAKLSSEDWRRQTSALRAVYKVSMDPARFEIDGRRISSSPYIPLRYWYAASLGNSKNAAAQETLMHMLDDPHPNVVCMAYFGLGNSGALHAAGEIKSRIPISRHWYVQWYAYRSLRQLGWTQKISTTN